MKTLIALLLLTTTASAQVWTERCGPHVLTSTGDVFVLQKDGKDEMTCRQASGVMSCDNGETIPAKFDGILAEFNGLWLFSDKVPLCD